MGLLRIIDVRHPKCHEIITDGERKSNDLFAIHQALYAYFKGRTVGDSLKLTNKAAVEQEWEANRCDRRPRNANDIVSQFLPAREKQAHVAQVVREELESLVENSPTSDRAQSAGHGSQSQSSTGDLNRHTVRPQPQIIPCSGNRYIFGPNIDPNDYGEKRVTFDSLFNVEVPFQWAQDTWRVERAWEDQQLANGCYDAFVSFGGSKLSARMT